MDWKLEAIVVPVGDVERAKQFYAGTLGFNLDVDHRDGDFRVVQATPPGSACSITFGSSLNPSPPGTLGGLQISVDDIEAAHAHLVERGVEAGEIQHFVHGQAEPGPRPGPCAVQLVHLLRRPGRQPLGDPRARALSRVRRSARS